MQGFLSFFGLTDWNTPSVVVGLLLLYLAALFAGLLIYGARRWRDCHGQPWVEVEARVLSKHYSPAESGTKQGYSYGYDPAQNGFGYRYGPTSYNNPESHEVDVVLENQQFSFPVSAELYAQLETSRLVRISGRRGRHSGRFYAKEVVGALR